MSVAIETDRLVMTRPTLDDAPMIEAMINSEGVGRYLPSNSPEDAFNRVLRNEGGWSFYGSGPLIVREKAGGALAGQCGLFHGRRGLGEDFDPFPEAGWVIAADYHGKGYAGEAMVAILDWVRREHGVRRVVAIIDPDNLPSIRLAEKMGFGDIGQAIYKDSKVVRFAWEAV